MSDKLEDNYPAVTKVEDDGPISGKFLNELFMGRVVENDLSFLNEKVTEFIQKRLKELQQDGFIDLYGQVYCHKLADQFTIWYTLREMATAITMTFVWGSTEQSLLAHDVPVTTWITNHLHWALDQMEMLGETTD